MNWIIIIFFQFFRWPTAIDRFNPLFLYNSAIFSEHRRFSNYRRDCFICIKRTFDNLLDNEPRCYILKLPTFPKDFEQKIIRYCLEQLFNCIFEYALFGEIVFNPEMINLLFDNDKAIPLQFNIQNPYLFPSGNERFDNIWNFVSNHLTTSECLIIDVDNIDSLYAGRKLFNILTTEGSKLPQIQLINVRVKWLYNAIVEVSCLCEIFFLLLAKLSLFACFWLL